MQSRRKNQEVTAKIGSAHQQDARTSNEVSRPPQGSATDSFKKKESSNLLRCDEHGSPFFDRPTGRSAPNNTKITGISALKKPRVRPLDEEPEQDHYQIEDAAEWAEEQWRTQERDQRQGEERNHDDRDSAMDLVRRRYSNLNRRNE